MIKEIKIEDEDLLIDLIATYGEGLLIKYFSESILQKEYLMSNDDEIELPNVDWAKVLKVTIT
jgi:hypothetical protein